MNKKIVTENDQQFREEIAKKDKTEKGKDKTGAFDELYKGTCYVVKDRADSYKLKQFPASMPKEKTKQFHAGDRVKNKDGRVLTVLVQLDKLVVVKEEVTNYNASDLTIIEASVKTYKV